MERVLKNEVEINMDVDDDFAADGVDLYDDMITKSGGLESDSGDGRPSALKSPNTPTSNNIETVAEVGSPVDRELDRDRDREHVAPLRKHQVYIGNLTWWTSDTDIEERLAVIGVHDFVEVQFYENRANGQSKGYCVLTVGSDPSIKLISEKFGKKEIHGQLPIVSPPTKQALNQFESQCKTRPSSGQGNQGNMNMMGRQRGGPMGMGPQMGVAPRTPMNSYPLHGQGHIQPPISKPGPPICRPHVAPQIMSGPPPPCAPAPHMNPAFFNPPGSHCPPPPAFATSPVAKVIFPGNDLLSSCILRLFVWSDSKNGGFGVGHTALELYIEEEEANYFNGRYISYYHPKPTPGLTLSRNRCYSTMQSFRNDVEHFKRLPEEMFCFRTLNCTLLSPFIRKLYDDNRLSYNLVSVTVDPRENHDLSGPNNCASVCAILLNKAGIRKLLPPRDAFLWYEYLLPWIVIKKITMTPVSLGQICKVASVFEETQLRPETQQVIFIKLDPYGNLILLKNRTVMRHALKADNNIERRTSYLYESLSEDVP